MRAMGAEFFVGASCANRVREGTEAATKLLSSADGKKQLQVRRAYVRAS
jgi:hypothetical protein